MRRREGPFDDIFGRTLHGSSWKRSSLRALQHCGNIMLRRLVENAWLTVLREVLVFQVFASSSSSLELRIQTRTEFQDDSDLAGDMWTLFIASARPARAVVQSFPRNILKKDPTNSTISLVLT